MRKDTNRTFFYFETENDAGQTIVRVGSEKAPLWNKSYDSVPSAIEAIKRRNSSANSFTEGRNQVTAVYKEPVIVVSE